MARPHSVGSVSLKSNNPRDHPSIKTGYLSDTRDLKTIREGLKLSRKIAKTSSFAKYIGKEVFPGEHVQSDAELDHYIREVSYTLLSC